MELIQIAKQIETKISLLEQGRGELEKRAREKANTLCEYEKTMEKQILILREQGVPATIIKDIAKGECYKERLAMDLAESMYKITMVKIEAVKAEMNGYQSINRHISET